MFYGMFDVYSRPHTTHGRSCNRFFFLQCLSPPFVRLAVAPADGEENPLTDRAAVALPCLDLYGAAGTQVSLPDGLVRVTGMLPQFTLVVVSLSVYK